MRVHVCALHVHVHVHVDGSDRGGGRDVRVPGGDQRRVRRAGLGRTKATGRMELVLFPTTRRVGSAGSTLRGRRRARAAVTTVVRVRRLYLD